MGTVYWIWLQQLFGIATARSHQMMKDFSHPQELYEKITQKELPADFLAQQERHQCSQAMEKAKSLEHRTLSKGCDIITPDHEDYPPLLREIYAAPAALYSRGNLACLKETFPITIVGTRHCSEYGIEVATSFAQGLVTYGITVVSGLAHGIDSYAQAAALEGGGHTVGVLACGLDIDYPKGNAALKTAVRRQGAVISEFPLGEPPKPYHFLPRNRVLAGISRGVLIIEAGKTSGALITANHALDMGREVFVVPGSIFTGKHVGSHGLIQQSKAKLVSSPQEMLEEFPEYLKGKLKQQALATSEKLVEEISLSPPFQTSQTQQTQQKRRENALKSSHSGSPRTSQTAKPLPRRKPLPKGLDDITQKVYAAVSQQKQTADQLAAAASLSIAEVLATLTVLEILGLVQSFPGGFFALGN